MARAPAHQQHRANTAPQAVKQPHKALGVTVTFIGEAGAGQRSAILYTIIEACRSRGIDPQSYLRDVLTRLPTLTNRQIKDIFSGK